MKRTYLDYTATIPCAEKVLEAMQNYFRDEFKNPFSLHSCGQRVRKAREGAREKIAKFLNASLKKLGVGLLSTSTHKLYGGVFCIRKGTKILSFMHRGEQKNRK